MPEPHDHLVRQHRRRMAILVVIVAGISVVAATEPLYRFVSSIVAGAEPVMQRHPIAGAVLFVLLSALSAMVVFFSTAVVTPIAIDAFGTVTTLLLLWVGWIIGGVTAYGIGRLLGHRVVRWFVDPGRLHQYERRASRLETFGPVLLFQLAVPSEIPGYVLGLTGCRFRIFVAAVALGELPYAIGAVYLGESFLRRNYVLLFTIGIAGIALSWAAFRRAAATWTSDRDDESEGSVTRGAVDDESLRDRDRHEEHVATDDSGSGHSAPAR